MDTSARVKNYLEHHSKLLELMNLMWSDPQLQCYSDEELPNTDEMMNGKSVFLAGPTSRNFVLTFNWRCLAVKYLRDSGFKGWIYVPEPRGFEEKGDFTERGYIYLWESKRLFSATHKLFWVPRFGVELLGLNTNLELGVLLGMILAEKPLSVFVGWPAKAERMGLPRHYATHAGLRVYDTLESLCEAVVEKS